MAAPKIDPFQDGEAEVLTDELALQESGEDQQAEADNPGGTPEAVPAEGQQPQQGKEPAAIPYPRFKEVNEGKKTAEARAEAAEKERNELRERWATLEGRRQLLTEQQQAAQAQAAQQRQAAERPDPTIDPTGAEIYDLKHMLAQQQANFEAMQQQLQQTQGGVQQDQQQREFNSWVDYQAKNYVQQDPEYYEKARHAADWRKSWWQELGPNAPASAVQDIVEKESIMIAAWAKQHGGNFAPAVAKLAAQLGYQPVQQQNGNGQTRPTMAPSARLQQVQAGQQRQGIGHLPGSGGENAVGYRQYTAAQIAAMSEAEFSRALASPKTKADLQYAMAIADGIEPGTGRL